MLAMRSCARLLALTVFAAAALPSVAWASTVSFSGNVLTITAGPGEGNDVKVNVAFYGGDLADVFTVTDLAGITPGAGCEVRDGTGVCAISPALRPTISVSLGDGNDRLALAFFSNQFAMTADGGPGDDSITASNATDVIRGGEGNDTVVGEGGNDQVLGEAGNDNLDGYSGDDDVSGGPGNDTVRGGSDADTVDGGPGTDLIEGDATGALGSPGSDTIRSRDGERDTVTCGFGSDSVTADEIDVIEAVECESVDKAGAGSGGGSGPTIGSNPEPQPDGTPGVAVAAASSIKFSKLLSKVGGAFLFAVSGPCSAVLKLTVAAADARRAKLGRGAVTLVRDTAAVPEAGIFAGTLEPPARFRRKLRALKRLKTTLSLSCTSGGKTGRDSTKITFKR